jgi:DNA-binding CsgD family transcriptional regulator
VETRRRYRRAYPNNLGYRPVRYDIEQDAIARFRNAIDVSDELLQRRAAPRVVVLTEGGEPLLAEPNRDAVIDRLIAVAAVSIASGNTEGEFELDGTRFIVRISAMQSDGPWRYVAIAEPRGTRGPLLDAMDRYGLTRRELDVLALIVQGASSREIARVLSIVPATVQDHVRSLCEKTGSRRRAELLARVLSDTPA